MGRRRENIFVPWSFVRFFEMVGFSFHNGGRRCIRQILEKYQAGESEGYTVKSKDEDFAISDYPLLQTEFFYDQKQGRDKHENEKNKEFNYSMFSYGKGISETVL